MKKYFQNFQQQYWLSYKIFKWEDESNDEPWVQGTHQ